MQETLETLFWSLGQEDPLPTPVFLENPMDRGAWWATVHEASKSRIRLKQLSTPPRGKEREPYFLNQNFDKSKHWHLGETYSSAWGLHDAQTPWADMPTSFLKPVIAAPLDQPLPPMKCEFSVVLLFMCVHESSLILFSKIIECCYFRSWCILKYCLH